MAKRRSIDEWRRIRLQYETSDISLRDLARTCGVSASTIMKVAARQKWKQSAAIAGEARAIVQQKTEAALEKAADEAADSAARQLVKDLQPLIEQKRAEHIKATIAIVESSRKRLGRMFESDELGQLPLDPKSESFIATAHDKYDMIGRRTLQMDQSGVGGVLNLNILTNQAAVVVQSENGRAAA